MGNVRSRRARIGTRVKRKFKYLPREPELEMTLFEKTPLLAIVKFTECFDEGGRQQFELPVHTGRFLVTAFRAFLEGQHTSLDAALGGKVAAQRKLIDYQSHNRKVLFAVVNELKAARPIPKHQRHVSPLQHAFEEVAEQLEMSAENVRRIWREGGPKGPKKRNRRKSEGSQSRD
jgi:hypothetical protein